MIKNKEQLLSLLESFIFDIREKLNVELKNAIYVETDLQNKVNGTHGNSQELYSKQLHYASRRTEELNTLSISPFFAKVIYANIIIAHVIKPNFWRQSCSSPVFPAASPLCSRFLPCFSACSPSPRKHHR